MADEYCDAVFRYLGEQGGGPIKLTALGSAVRKADFGLGVSKSPKRLLEDDERFIVDTDEVSLSAPGRKSSSNATKMCFICNVELHQKDETHIRGAKHLANAREQGVDGASYALPPQKKEGCPPLNARLPVANAVGRQLPQKEARNQIQGLHAKRAGKFLLRKRIAMHTIWRQVTSSARKPQQMLPQDLVLSKLSLLSHPRLLSVHQSHLRKCFWLAAPNTCSRESTSW